MRVLLSAFLGFFLVASNTQAQEISIDPIKDQSGKSQTWVTIDFYLYIEYNGQLIPDHMIMVNDEPITYDLTLANERGRLRRLSYTRSLGRYVQLGYNTQLGDTVYCGTYDGNGQLVTKQIVASANGMVWTDTLHLNSLAAPCEVLVLKEEDKWANDMVMYGYDIYDTTWMPMQDTITWVYNGDTAYGNLAHFPLSATTSGNLEVSLHSACSSSPKNVTLNSSAASNGTLSVNLSHAGQPLEGMIVFFYRDIHHSSRAGGYGEYRNFDNYQYTDANGNVTFSISGLSAGDSLYWRTAGCQSQAFVGGNLYLNSGASVNVNLVDSLSLNCLANTCKAAHRMIGENGILNYEAIPLWNPQLNLSPGNYIYKWEFPNRTNFGSTGAIPYQDFAGNLPVTYDFSLTDSCSYERGTIHYGLQGGPVRCWTYLAIDTPATAQANRTLYAYNRSGATPNTIINYAWDFGDGTTGSGAFPTHTYAGNGPYQLCLSIWASDSSGLDTCYKQTCMSIAFDANGNFVHKSQQQGFLLNILDPNIGIEEQSLEMVEVQIFPNPAKGRASKVIWQGDFEAEVEIVNAQGAIVQKLDQVKSGFELQNLESGFYFVKMHINGQVIVQRYIVQ